MDCRVNAGGSNGNASQRWSHIFLALPVLAIASAAMAVSVRSDDSSELGEPFPSDRYTVLDPNQRTGVRVALPKPNCSVHVSDCEDVDLINQLDGFNVQPRIVIPFSGAIDSETVDRRGVYLIEAGSSRRIYDLVSRRPGPDLRSARHAQGPTQFPARRGRHRRASLCVGRSTADRDLSWFRRKEDSRSRW